MRKSNVSFLVGAILTVLAIVPAYASQQSDYLTMIASQNLMANQQQQNYLQQQAYMQQMAAQRNNPYQYNNNQNYPRRHWHW